MIKKYGLRLLKIVSFIIMAGAAVFYLIVFFPIFNRQGICCEITPRLIAIGDTIKIGIMNYHDSYQTIDIEIYAMRDDGIFRHDLAAFQTILSPRQQDNAPSIYETHLNFDWPELEPGEWWLICTVRHGGQKICESLAKIS